MRVSVRLRRRLRPRDVVLQGGDLDLPAEPTERVSSPRELQYVVVNESIFGFAGQESPRTARSTHEATPAFGGFV